MKTSLPIESVLDDIKDALHLHDEVVLVAPPGAGKTTIVPLALKDEDWLKGKKILILEPRRIATKSAAYRMSNLINEPPGNTVGYRMRLDTKVSKHTKVEVITEGIMTRMLQQDPALEDVGLVIFDEFHERSLESDLALALCLKGRSIFRAVDDKASSPLKILIMSATLDSQKISDLLDNAPVVISEGKQYPVDIIYGTASQTRDNLVDRTITTTKQVVLDNPEGSILVFLPGQGEIKRTAELISQWILDRKLKNIYVHPLYGNLSIEAQQNAIAPYSKAEIAEGYRKIVLATNIAETSLTIEGVDIVVDTGLARQAIFDPATGMTRLHTRKISNASSIQRAGRAGRLKPGRCYRLWSADQQQQLAAHSTPEIVHTDLLPLALQLLQWGANDPSEFLWLDAPAKGPWSQAITLLEKLGAIQNEQVQLNAHGELMASLPLHPRLSHLLICGVKIYNTDIALQLASLLSDRDPFSQQNADISYRLDILSGRSNCPGQYRGWLSRTKMLAGQIEKQLFKLKFSTNSDETIGANLNRDQVIGYLLACAYPERIARQRHSGGYQLANGRSANLHKHISHTNSKDNANWLAIAEIGGMANSKGDNIRSAATLDPVLFEGLLKDQVSHQNIAEWDKKTKRFLAEERTTIGALVLNRKKLDKVPQEAKTDALINHIRKEGLDLLPWTTDIRQWQSRLELIHKIEGKPWPDLSDEILLSTLEDWLAPYLDPVNLLNDFKKLDLKSILENLLPWDLAKQVKILAPQRLSVPSGSSITINYNRSPPVLAVKLQEMFGSNETPSIINHKVPLLIHLLSPAGRPLQVTQDLEGFWQTSYQDVKKDMKGRYPKHPWPEDPTTAIATKKTKNALKRKT